MTVIQQTVTEDYSLFNGDCVEVIRDIPDESIDFGIHSPPFSNLYIYSDSEADMGNCSDNEEFFEHYKYLIPELLRVTVTGRLCAVHCKDLPRYANRDGTTGLIDFPGMIISAFEECGWSYHSRVTIWKCPVTERERTNNNGLLHKTVKRDRSQLRQGMADYLIVFRKPPTATLMSDKPVQNLLIRSSAAIDDDCERVAVGFTKYIGEDEFDPRVSTFHPSPYARTSLSKNEEGESINIWRRYAEPVWWDIAQTDVLNFKAATSEQDERHICPLQIGLIRRSVDLWTNPGDVVLSPFAGIGSEGYGSILEGRRFVGIELKPSYYETAIKNLNAAVNKMNTRRLF